MSTHTPDFIARYVAARRKNHLKGLLAADTKSSKAFAKQIKQAEQALGVKLPDSYVKLIKQSNGGYLTRNTFPTKKSTSWSKDHCEIASLYGVGEGGIDTKGPLLIAEWNYPKKCVLLGQGTSSGHNVVMLDYRKCGEDGEPSVIWVEAAETGNRRNRIVQLAPDFETFCKFLFDRDLLEAEAEELDEWLKENYRSAKVVDPELDPVKTKKSKAATKPKPKPSKTASPKTAKTSQKTMSEAELDAWLQKHSARVICEHEIKRLPGGGWDYNLSPRKPKQKKIIAVSILIDRKMDDISPLAHVPTLEKFVASSPKLTDFSPLAHCQNLRILSIGETGMTDLSFLQDLTAMEELSAGNRKLKSLEPLASLTSLKRLRITKSGVSDLSPLSNLKKLEQLCLDGCPVNDISPLVNLKSLKEVSLKGTKVSAAAVETLRESLPKCVVEAD